MKKKDKKLFGRLNKIKSVAKAKLKEIKKVLPEFTPHEIEHKEDVLDLYDSIIPKSLVQHMNKYELFCLIAATYLHDIGLAPLEELMDVEDISRLESKQYIRENHHERSETYVNKYYDKIGIEDDKQAFIIGRICRGHRIEELSDIYLFDSDYKYKYNYSINIRLLASFLKAADELDMTFKRTPRFMYEKIRFNSPVSKQEWEKHLSISGISRSKTDPLLLKASGRTKNPKIYRLIKNSEKKVDSQLQEIRHYLNQYQKYSRDIPTNFVADITPVDFIPENFKFSLAEKNIIQIITGLGLYRRREEAIRELLKNAIDACQRRKELSSPGLTYAPQIIFNFSRKDKTLLISDNGIGMNRSHIGKYLTKIGLSFYTSEEFSSSSHDYRPMSELGIGFLSAFMISKNIEIDTLMHKYEPLKIEIDDLLDYLILRHGTRTDLGTDVRLYLIDSIAENLDIVAEVTSYARHLPFTIHVKSEDSPETIIKNKQFKTSFDSINVPDQSKYGFLELQLNEEEFEGIIGIVMRKKEGNLLPLPYLEKVVETGFPVLTSSKGIRLDDKFIIPWWLNSSKVYVDIDFKKLKLDASRNRFVYDEHFFQVYETLELKVIKFLANYFEKLRKEYHNEKDLMILTFNLFESCIITFLYQRPFEYGLLTENFLKFYKEYYLFKVISNGKLSYMNFNNIISKDYELIYDLVFEYSHINGYLAELAENSSAFKANCNYVIFGHDTMIRNQSIEKSFLEQLFSKRKLYEFKDFIGFTELSTISELMPKWLKLVRFKNYQSDNIVDDISDLILINSENPFVKLIIENKSFFLRSTNRLLLEAFFDKLSIRLHYQIKEVVEYQKRMLDLLVEEKIITEQDTARFILNEANFPSGPDYETLKKFS